MGDSNHSNFCCKNNIMRCKQSGRILESTEDNSPVQVLDKPTRREVFMDLVLTTVEIITEVKAGGCLGCSNCVLVEFMVSRNMVLMKSSARTSNIRRAKFQLFKELLCGIPQETVLEDKGME